MWRRLGGGWVMTEKKPYSDDGRPVFLANRCRHGHRVSHDLDAALKCGLLRQVAGSRRQAELFIADAMGMAPETLDFYWTGQAVPRDDDLMRVMDYLEGRIR